MSWHVAMENADKTLNSSLIPSSLDIISLIKKVNPTTVSLSNSERERGYEMKSRLQNLLLEQFGEAFYIVPHPLNSNIVLIKHATLPSVDACHAELAALSEKALDSVAAHNPAHAAERSAKHPRKVKRQCGAAGDSPAQSLKRGQDLLAEYEFAEAGELFRSIRISDRDDVGTVERAARALLGEMGAYGEAIELLLAQKSQFLRDPRLRVLLARAYHLSGALPEARAILDTMPRGDLDKEALVAYADMAHKDGNLLLAWNLLKAAEETEGYAESMASLKKDVVAAMHAEAQPLLARALSAQNCGETAEAEFLARQVLKLSPNNLEAREIVARIDAGRRNAEVADLWGRLAQVKRCEARLELLEMLSERDRENRDQIAELITVEKVRQKKELVQARLGDLQNLANAGAWPDAFDLIWWLHGQGEGDACREACSISPYFSVLYENRRLRRISERSARQLWLDFVQASASLESGHPAGSLEILEGVKHYFEKYEPFREIYERALRGEQEKSREEIREFLCLAAKEDTTLCQAHHYYSVIHKATVHLATAEREEFRRIMEARIAQLTPPQTEEWLIEAYKEAALFGNHEKAAILRSQISDQTTIEAFDAELAEKFTIERSPVRLEFSDTLTVDLSSDQPLSWLGSTDRHIFLREADDAILLVHLEKLTATRFTSPNFKDLYITDAIPPDDTFLFTNVKKHVLKWRAELSDAKSAFTACFDAGVFREEMNDAPVDVALSSERATDYYVLIYDREGTHPGRVVRKRLGSRSPVSDSTKAGIKVKPLLRRLSWHPDKFFIGAENDMKLCAKNLTFDYRLEMSPQDIWAIDLANGHIYYIDQAILKRTDLEFEHTERFVNSPCCFFFKERHRKLGLCPATNTLMIGFGPKAALYDFIENRISSPFSWGRVIGTKPARKWYTYDYCKETRTLKLRDVTADLATLLEWEEAATPIDGRQDDNPDWQLKLYRQIYLGVEPEEQAEK
jgi:hypothetical protein